MKQALSFLTAIVIAMSVHAQQVIPLYPNGIPNSIASGDQELSTHNGVLRIEKVSRPTLTAYLPSPQQANGTAVIICPGGGYGMLAAGHEGAQVAQAFNKAGVAAFVLKYRLPDSAIMINKEIGPLQDAQRAIQLVRSRAADFHVHPQKVGIMGFSAGGHLAATAGTHFTQPLIENSGNVSLRPDFMVLIYPVISFQDSLTHIGSRHNLLGAHPSQQQIDAYSNELQVTAQTPPTFLVHAGDDDVVKVANSLLFYQALLQHKVAAEMHLYQSGGHGFGLRLPKSKDRWLERCTNWMAANGWLSQQ